MSCWVASPGDQGEREELRFRRFLHLHGYHGTQLRQRQHPSGHHLVSHVGIVIPVEHVSCFNESSASSRSNNFMLIIPEVISKLL